MELLKILNKDEIFKYNTMLMVLVAHKPREGECQQVHTGVSCYHRNNLRTVGTWKLTVFF
ncbi:MAG: hypothetical protein PVH55_06345 [Desulfobacterales bacterium]